MLMVGLVFTAALDGLDGNEYVKPTVNHMVLRVLTCYLFHLTVYDDVVSSYRRLKYLRYNADKFQRNHIILAFIVCQY
jgi:hypothetical protein